MARDPGGARTVVRRPRPRGVEARSRTRVLQVADAHERMNPAPRTDAHERQRVIQVADAHERQPATRRVFRRPEPRRGLLRRAIDQVTGDYRAANRLANRVLRLPYDNVRRDLDQRRNPERYTQAQLQREMIVTPGMGSSIIGAGQAGVRVLAGAKPVTSATRGLRKLVPNQPRQPGQAFVINDNPAGYVGDMVVPGRRSWLHDVDRDITYVARGEGSTHGALRRSLSEEYGIPGYGDDLAEGWYYAPMAGDEARIVASTMGAPGRGFRSLEQWIQLLTRNLGIEDRHIARSPGFWD